jgi:hypothetical protein
LTTGAESLRRACSSAKSAENCASLGLWPLLRNCWYPLLITHPEDERVADVDEAQWVVGRGDQVVAHAFGVVRDFEPGLHVGQGERLDAQAERLQLPDGVLPDAVVYLVRLPGAERNPVAAHVMPRWSAVSACPVFFPCRW